MAVSSSPAPRSTLLSLDRDLIRSFSTSPLQLKVEASEITHRVRGWERIAQPSFAPKFKGHRVWKTWQTRGNRRSPTEGFRALDKSTIEAEINMTSNPSGSVGPELQDVSGDNWSTMTLATVTLDFDGKAGKKRKGASLPPGCEAKWHPDRSTSPPMESGGSSENSDSTCIHLNHDEFSEAEPYLRVLISPSRSHPSNTRQSRQVNPNPASCNTFASSSETADMMECDPPLGSTIHHGDCARAKRKFDEMEGVQDQALPRAPGELAHLVDANNVCGTARAAVRIEAYGPPRSDKTLSIDLGHEILSDSKEQQIALICELPEAKEHGSAVSPRSKEDPHIGQTIVKAQDDPIIKEETASEHRLKTSPDAVTQGGKAVGSEESHVIVERLSFAEAGATTPQIMGCELSPATRVKPVDISQTFVGPSAQSDEERIYTAASPATTDTIVDPEVISDADTEELPDDHPFYFAAMHQASVSQRNESSAACAIPSVSEADPDTASEASAPSLESMPVGSGIALYSHLADDMAVMTDFLNRVRAEKAVAAAAATAATTNSAETSAPTPLVTTCQSQSDTSPSCSLFVTQSVPPPLELNRAQNAASTSQRRQSKRTCDHNPRGDDKASIEHDSADEATTYRRSKRLRQASGPKSVTIGPSLIPRRRLDGTDRTCIVLRKTDVQELAILTRVNTRCNTGRTCASVLRAKRGKMHEEQDTDIEIKHVDEHTAKKMVTWDERLEYFQDSSLDNPDQLENDAERDEMYKEFREKRKKRKQEEKSGRRVILLPNTPARTMRSQAAG